VHRENHRRVQAHSHLAAARTKFTSAGEDTQTFDTERVLKRLDHIADLLDKGREAEAIGYAAVVAFLESLARTRRAEKANFNPAEPREPDTGRWIKDGGENSPKGLIELVQYRGHFHDAVVDEFMKGFAKAGAKAVKNVVVTGINGVSAIPDAIVLPVESPIPYVLEVKTGADPPFTKNQQQVYPLICMGGHAASLSANLSTVGLQPGVPFPKMDVWVAYTEGPGQQVQMMNYCAIIGLR
jgi:hypothetical protein